MQEMHITVEDEEARPTDGQWREILLWVAESFEDTEAQDRCTYAVHVYRDLSFDFGWHEPGFGWGCHVEKNEAGEYEADDH